MPQTDVKAVALTSGVWSQGLLLAMLATVRNKQSVARRRVKLATVNGMHRRADAVCVAMCLTASANAVQSKPTRAKTSSVTPITSTRITMPQTDAKAVALTRGVWSQGLLLATFAMDRNGTSALR